MTISYTVNQQTITRDNTASIPRKGSREYLYLKFSFSADWSGLIKSLYVSSGEYSNTIIVEDGVAVLIPEYYTQQSSFSITLCGVLNNEFVPTNVVSLLLEESNDVWEEIAPDPEDIPYQQLMALVQQAIENLPSVTSVDNGKFLRVVNGAWAAVNVPNANGVSF